MRKFYKRHGGYTGLAGASPGLPGPQGVPRVNLQMSMLSNLLRINKDTYNASKMLIVVTSYSEHNTNIFNLKDQSIMRNVPVVDHISTPSVMYTYDVTVEDYGDYVDIEIHITDSESIAQTLLIAVM